MVVHIVPSSTTSPPIAGLDYISIANQSLVFDSVNTFAEVAVGIINDTALEAMERLFASLEIRSAETRGVLLDPSEAAVDIQDNDGLWAYPVIVSLPTLHP